MLLDDSCMHMWTMCPNLLHDNSNVPTMTLSFYALATRLVSHFKRIFSGPTHLTTKMKGSVKEPNMSHNYETEKITHKASDVAENLQLYRGVRFFRPRSSCTTHLMLFSERPPIYASCMTISGGRTEQHVIIGFRELPAVNYNMYRHTLSILTEQLIFN